MFIKVLEEIYRVLRQETDGCWVIRFENPQRPQFLSAAQMEVCQRVPAPKRYLQSTDAKRKPSKAETKKTAMLQPMIDDLYCISDYKRRKKLSEQIAEKHHTTPRRIYQLYLLYLAQDSLMPKPRERYVESDTEVFQIYRQAIETLYYSAKRPSCGRCTTACYPNLVIENCSSGGLRMDYAMLARYPLQSTSDQEDYIYTASIAANAPTAVTPEQAGVWSYPLADSTAEQTAFNMVNALLMRIHQSGRPDIITPECFAVIKEGIDCYKQMRDEVSGFLPFWPIGLSALGDEWISLGMEAKNRIFIAVWRCNSKTETISLPVPQWKGRKAQARCFYPKSLPSKCIWNQETGSLSAVLPASVSARIFMLERLDAEDDA